MSVGRGSDELCFMSQHKYKTYKPLVYWHLSQAWNEADSFQAYHIDFMVQCHVVSYVGGAPTKHADSACMQHGI